MAFSIALPTIEGEASAIDSISVIRGQGRLLTDGDQVLVGLSHQLEIPASDLTGNEDDIITDLGIDLWWVHGLSETDHVQDRLEGHPELVAGPQTVVYVNKSGATTAIRVDITWHPVRGIDLTRWALLKSLTSYERNA